MTQRKLRLLFSYTNLRHKRKHGVSAIIGALLLVVMAIGMFAVVLAFATNAGGTASSGLSNLIQNSGNQLAEQLSVNQAAFNLTSVGSFNAGVDLFIQNIGPNPVSVSGIFVVIEQTGALVTSYLPSSAIRIQPGSIQVIPIVFTPTNGLAYEFVIATQLGSKFTYTTVA